MYFPLLSIITFLPLLGAIVLVFLWKKRDFVFRITALVFTGVVFLFAIWLCINFQPNAEVQFVEKYQWIPHWGVNCYLGVDGINLFMILLTTFLTPVAVLTAWDKSKASIKGFLISILVFETGIIGVFVAFDLFLFYFFWEFTLMPMFFILSNGEAENAVPAAIKFFVYSIVGSLPVLIGVLVIYFYNGGFTGDYTFDILKLSQVQLPVKYQTWLFAAFAFSFALRIPLFPFHTWFIDSCVSTSTGGCIMLAAVAMKMGLYGFLRFCLPFFPYAVEQFTPVLFAIGIATLIYMAAIAIVQNDMKKVAVYGAISQLSLVIIGIFTLNNQSVQGSLLHMVNHGLAIAALFLVTGMIYARRKTNLMTDFGGLAKRAPVLTTLFMIIVLSFIGLPGLNGFVGEFLILLGVFFSHKIVAILVLAGAVLTIVYMLKLFQTVMLGKLQNVRNIKFDDLSKREIAMLTPIIIFMILIGAYPNLFLEKIAPAVDHLIKTAALWQNH